MSRPAPLPSQPVVPAPANSLTNMTQADYDRTRAAARAASERAAQIAQSRRDILPYQDSISAPPEWAVNARNEVLAYDREQLAGLRNVIFVIPVLGNLQSAMDSWQDANGGTAVMYLVLAGVDAATLAAVVRAPRTVPNAAQNIVTQAEARYPALAGRTQWQLWQLLQDVYTRFPINGLPSRGAGMW